MVQVEKRPGADWEIYYMDIADGSREWMSVFGASTPEEAIAEARWSLNALCDSEEEKDYFEILVVVRLGCGVDIRI